VRVCVTAALSELEEDESMAWSRPKSSKRSI